MAKNNLKINGIVYGDLTQSVNDRLNLKKLADNFWNNSRELDNVWGQVPPKYLNQVKELINKTYSNIDLSNETKGDNVVLLNRDNVNKLLAWQSSEQKGYKRTIILEIIGAKGNSLYIFENMEISDFKEGCNSLSGNGTFEMILKKSLMNSPNYEIYISKERLAGIPL